MSLVHVIDSEHPAFDRYDNLIIDISRARSLGERAGKRELFLRLLVLHFDLCGERKGERPGIFSLGELGHFRAVGQGHGGCP